eukprot:2396178-Pleurochrysis_carterae.AAC.1
MFDAEFLTTLANFNARTMLCHVIVHAAYSHLFSICRSPLVEGTRHLLSQSASYGAGVFVLLQLFSAVFFAVEATRIHKFLRDVRRRSNCPSLVQEKSDSRRRIAYLYFSSAVMLANFFTLGRKLCSGHTFLKCASGSGRSRCAAEMLPGVARLRAIVARSSRCTLRST